MKILIGNTFPLTLIRRAVHIIPRSKESLARAVADRELYSFWGHEESLPHVQRYLGLDLTPRHDRPALTVDLGNWPVLHGVRFRECWIVTPVQPPGARPAVGTCLPAHRFGKWQVLHMQWL